MNARFATLLGFGAIAAIVACAGPQQSVTLPPSVPKDSGRVQRPAKSSPITHIVLIFQENRTPDDLFQAMAAKGANIQSWGTDAKGERVNLKEVSLATSYDLGHGHTSFLNDYDCGKMDGFDVNLKPKFHMRPFSYAPLSEVQPYVDMAEQYVFGDNMFETQQAGSFPAHQEIISGTAAALPMTADNDSSDPFSSKSGEKAPAGCDGPKFEAVDTIDPSDGSAGPTPRPCFNRPVLPDLLDKHGLTWRYYQNGLGTGLWHAFDAIKHIRYGRDYVNVVTPPQSILTDIATNNLPNMSWVMPADGSYSDHPGNRSATGPSWVAAVVNAVGESPYWNSTAIVITWDDWGGLYDHVPPPMMNNWYELGFRVPLVIVSPYAKAGYISHVQHEFGSILAFAEVTFGMQKGGLHSSDVRADDLKDAFNFKQQPRAFVPINAPPFAPGKISPSIANAEDPDNEGGATPASSCMNARH